jgi:hypothetical protein
MEKLSHFSEEEKTLERDLYLSTVKDFLQIIKTNIQKIIDNQSEESQEKLKILEICIFNTLTNLNIAELSAFLYRFEDELKKDIKFKAII